MKSRRIVAGTILLGVVLAALPLSKAIALKTSLYSTLKDPLLFSRNAAQVLTDYFHFQENADELRLMKRSLSGQKTDDPAVREVWLENERLTRLLGVRQLSPGFANRLMYARVIGRSPSAWNRVFLIDKGVREGVHVNQPVLSAQSILGKIIEAGPSVSKALLLTDPNSRVGVMIQRTRQQGILYGTISGECRIKYLSIDAEIKSGDTVVTAGFGGFFPKGVLVGKVLRAWKEPGQLYQVALVSPATDLSRVEEVACLV